MNYLQEIVKKILTAYDICIDDRFELRYAEDNEQVPGIYRFNKHYKLETQKYDGDSAVYWCEEWNKMESILTGTMQIYPLTFHPDNNEIFYYVYWVSWDNDPVVGYTRWIGNDEDYMRLSFGNVFRTETQAMVNRDKIRQKILEAAK